MSERNAHEPAELRAELDQIRQQLARIQQRLAQLAEHVDTLDGNRTGGAS